MLGEARSTRLPARPAGQPDHERDMERLGEEAGLAQHPVVAQHLAVIGGEQDQRPLELAAPRQRREDPAEMMIDLGDQAEIDRPQPRQARAVQQAAPIGAGDRCGKVGGKPRMQRAFGRPPSRPGSGAGTASGATMEYQGSAATNGGCGLRKDRCANQGAGALRIEPA